MPTPKRGPKRKPAKSKPSDSASLGSWDPPSHLNPEAAAAWRHVVKLLAPAGNLGRTDPTLVECYAMNVALLRGAYAAVLRDGPTVLTSHKLTINHPAMTTINSATMRIKAIVNDLGLCPASSKHATSIITVSTAEKDADTEEREWSDILGISG